MILSQIATTLDYKDWVLSKSRPVDLNYEMGLVEKLDKIMNYYLQEHRYLGISSNNVFWDQTPEPISVVKIPYEKNFLTLINPEIKRESDEKVITYETCASIGLKEVYFLKRPFWVEIEGLNLKNEKINLFYPHLSTEGFVAGHELDHLDGVLISHRAKEVENDEDVIEKIQEMRNMRKSPN